MNQILQTSLKQKKVRLIKNTGFLKIQLYFSVLLIVVLVIFTIHNLIKTYQAESYSNTILSNYNITKLYTNLNSTKNRVPSSTNKFSVIGTIEIPEINIYYPIFSHYDEDLLKVSPCKFYGTNPGEKGNLCIAGHNYDNNKFFSKISLLKKNSEIIIHNSFNKKIVYRVSEKYEISPKNLSPIYNYNKDLIGLTLITCNNVNKKRIIVKAFV